MVHPFIALLWEAAGVWHEVSSSASSNSTLGNTSCYQGNTPFYFFLILNILILLLEPRVVWYDWLKTRDCRTVICDMLVFPCLFTGYCPKPSTWNTKRKLSEYQAQINSQCLVNALFADYTSLIYMRVPTNMGLLFSLWSDLLVHPRVLEVELQVKPF